MTKRILPTPEQLRQLLRYEPDTGKLYWKVRPAEMFSEKDPRGQRWSANKWNTRFAGKEAFTSTDKTGYKCGGIHCKIYKAHRVAWAIYHGKWPEEFIDHINMVRDDNRIINLREATRSENGFNREKQSNNSSGLKGVHWSKKYGKWVAKAKVMGKTHYFGFHDTKEQAIEAYKNSIRSIHGEFSRIG